MHVQECSRNSRRTEKANAVKCVKTLHGPLRIKSKKWMFNGEIGKGDNNNGTLNWN